MSWSVSFIGTPAKVVVALQEESAKLSGQSKVEYDAALPYMAGLVSQVFAEEGSNFTQPIVKLSASGHGSARSEPNGDQPPTVKQIQRTCSVSLETMHHKLLV